jgi:phosphatidate cytidylyltransferase
VGDDKRGDELFEDLDKFFAPIKDVDWDEPDEPSGRAPEEEHVEVRTSAPPGPEPVQDEEDEDWSGAGPAESLDDLVDEGEEGEDEASFEGEEELVVMSDVPSAGPGQGDLFDEDEGIGSGDFEDEDWVSELAESAETTESAEPTASEEAPEPTIRIDIEDEELTAPTEEDLEAAAAHFAGSLSDQERYDTQPVDVYGTDTGNDLLADLGSPEDLEEDILSDLEPEEAPRTVTVGAEGISGPSWQEPAAIEVGASVESRGPGPGERDVPAAFMTGLVLAGVALASLLVGQAAFAVVATVAILVAQGEFFGVMVKHHAQPATAVGLVAGALMMAGAYFRGEAATPAMFSLGVVAAFAWYMTVPAAYRKDVLKNVGLTVLNMAWIPLLAGYLIATLKMPEGRALVVAVVGLTFVFDTAAFLVGSIWGGSFFQRPLAPNISPKKSLEGLVGAALVTVVVSVALVPSFIDLFHDRRVDALLLAIVVSIAATLGDLAESLVKRDLGLKDMGSVLPGHGGVLDRIDSLLFVAPAAFLLFRIVVV